MELCPNLDGFVSCFSQPGIKRLGWIVAVSLGQIFSASSIALTEEPRERGGVAKTGQCDKDLEKGRPNVPTVVGTIVTPDDLAVPGIKILAFNRGNRLKDEFVTDHRGQFRVPKAWRSSSQYLTLVAQDGNDRLGWFDFFFHARSGDGKKAEDGSFKIVLLPMNRTLRGRLLDEAGQPIANAQVAVNYLEHEVNFVSAHWRHQKIDEQPLLKEAVTDDEGRYELTLPANTFAWLGSVHPEFVSRRIHVAKDAATLPDTRLLRAARIVGCVVDSRTGKPISSASVVALATQPDMDSGGRHEAKTDEHGNYVINGLPAGTFDIMLNSSFKTLTTLAHQVKLTSGESRKHDFFLFAGHRLAGKVVDAETNQPVAGCAVACSGPSRAGRSVLSTQSDKNGDFEFFVPPGMNQIFIDERRENIFEMRAEIEISENEDREPVKLKAGRKLEVSSIKILVGHTLDRRISVHFEVKSLSDALKNICQSANLRLQLGAKIEPVEESTSLDVDGIRLRSALNLIFRRLWDEPFGNLIFEVDGDLIDLVVVENANEINVLVINARLDREISGKYEDQPLSEVLVDIASRLSVRLEIDESDIRAADLENALTAIAVVSNADLNQQLIQNPENLWARVRPVVDRREGMIRGRELLDLLLEPMGLDFYIFDDVVHVTTSEKAAGRNRTH